MNKKILAVLSPPSSNLKGLRGTYTTVKMKTTCIRRAITSMVVSYAPTLVLYYSFNAGIYWFKGVFLAYLPYIVE